MDINKNELKKIIEEELTILLEQLERMPQRVVVRPGEMADVYEFPPETVSVENSPLSQLQQKGWSEDHSTGEYVRTGDQARKVERSKAIAARKDLESYELVDDDKLNKLRNLAKDKDRGTEDV